MKTLADPRERAEILRRLRAVRPDTARRWGRMSAHQMVCHLADGFRMAIGQKDVRPATGPLQRTVLKWTALYAPLPWPHGIRTLPDVDQEIGGTKPLEFARDVVQLEALLDLFASRAQPLAGRAHPMFGPLSEAAWFRWAYLHMDHHLRQFGA